METTSSGSMRSSAGCRYSAGSSLYSAHTGTIGEPRLYDTRGAPVDNIDLVVFLAAAP